MITDKMKLIPLHKDKEHVKHTLGIALYWLMEEIGRSATHNVPMEKAAKVFDRNYQHGGGWRPFALMSKYKVGVNFKNDGVYRFPGDPPSKPVARIEFGDEILYAYDHAMWCIIQPDGTFEIARMD